MGGGGRWSCPAGDLRLLSPGRELATMEETGKEAAMQARHIMTTPAVCVRPGTPLPEVAAILAEHGFTAVPVIDAEERLVGLVSEADLIRERFGLHPHRAPDDEPRATAAEVMTSPVEFVRPDTTVSVLAKCMITGRRRSVPVLEDRTVVGMVTRRDIVQTMACSDEEILAEVHRRLDLADASPQWLVRVRAGVVHLWGDAHREGAEEVTQLTESVPGVVRVTVSGPSPRGDDRSVAVTPTHR